MDAQIEQLEQRSHNLLQEIKKVGPDLKEVRMKIHKEWIPYWLKHTHEFRPDHENAAVPPAGRRDSGHLRLHLAIGHHRARNFPSRLRETPRTAKSCSKRAAARPATRSAKVPNLVGGDFAANLSRVGEKDNYDYLVRWILNPRTRTRPYCPFEKKDLGPEDYAKHDLPFVFDLDHSRCPNDGHELVVAAADGHAQPAPDASRKRATSPASCSHRSTPTRPTIRRPSWTIRSSRRTARS